MRAHIDAHAESVRADRRCGERTVNLCGCDRRYARPGLDAPTMPRWAQAVRLQVEARRNARAAQLLGKPCPEISYPARGYTMP